MVLAGYAMFNCSLKSPGNCNSTKKRRGMSQLTGQQVLTILMNEPDYLILPESIRKAMEPFILATPNILKVNLNKQVNLSVLMDSKLKFLHYCQKNEFISLLLKALPDDYLKGLKRDVVYEATKCQIAQLISFLNHVAKHTSLFLADSSLTELQMMSHPCLSLKPEVLLQYQSNHLTIADLLLLQPSSIVKYTD